jgi:hypothetical protein
LEQARGSGEAALPRDGQKEASAVSDQRQVGREFLIGCIRHERPTVRGLSDQWTSELNLGLWAMLQANSWCLQYSYEPKRPPIFDSRCCADIPASDSILGQLLIIYGSVMLTVFSTNTSIVVWHSLSREKDSLRGGSQRS